MKILITGASGNAGRAVAALLGTDRRFSLRLADVGAPPAELADCGEFVRCDTRTPGDARDAVTGCDAVIHLAAWHCGHQPPVSDDTIFAVNVDGTYNILQACRAAKVKALVFASSMAWGHGSVYSVTKVLGEDLCRMFHQTSGGTPTVCLRYHDFVPKPYLAHGQKLLYNGVDRADVASATVASLHAALSGKVSFFMTIVHHQLRAPAEVLADFPSYGPRWLEQQVPDAGRLMEKYGLHCPRHVEQHDLSQAAERLNWRPAVNFLTFLRDLARRDAKGEDVKAIFVPGQIPPV
jgi:hypothetical protein